MGLGQGRYYDRGLVCVTPSPINVRRHVSMISVPNTVLGVDFLSIFWFHRSVPPLVPSSTSSVHVLLSFSVPCTNVSPPI